MLVRPFNAEWLNTLHLTMFTGHSVAPRGKPTKELLHHTVTVDMRYPVLTIQERKLSYQFMAAEAFWILSGDERVAGIAPWNKNIGQFSDDGVVFAGAYGPMVSGQLDYVVRTLANDPDTRQAVMVIWRRNPAASKDIPCTVALDFKLRHGKLNCHAFMRSSDQWMGLPYDVFNFSMLSHLVCGLVNEQRPHAQVEPGALFLTAASSHLYEPQWDAATTLLASTGLGDAPAPTPKGLFTVLHEGYRPVIHLMATLEMLRDTKPGDLLRWWESRVDVGTGNHASQLAGGTHEAL